VYDPNKLTLEQMNLDRGDDHI